MGGVLFLMLFSSRNNFLIARKQMLMEFNGAREIVRRDQVLRYRGIHPRQEPCAVISLAGICGGAGVTPASTETRANKRQSQKARGLTLRREKRNRLFVKGNEGFPAEPASLVGNDAIGEIPTRFEHRQSSLYRWSVYFHVCGGK